MTERISTIKFLDLGFGGLFKIVFWASILPWLFVVMLWVLFAFLDPERITMFGVKLKTTADALKNLPIAFAFVLGQAAFTGFAGAGMLRIFGKYLPLGNLN